MRQRAALTAFLLVAIAACSTDAGPTTTTTTEPLYAPVATVPIFDVEARVTFADGSPAELNVHLSIDGEPQPAMPTSASGIATWKGFDPGVASAAAWTLCQIDVADTCMSYAGAPAVAGLEEGLNRLELVMQPVWWNLTTSGTIAHHEIWTGDVHLSGPVVVVAGGSLTIAPGTRVHVPNAVIDATTDFDMQIGSDIIGHGGPVVALGTPESPVYFGAADPEAAWNGISGWMALAFVEAGGFESISPTSASQISHARLTGANQLRCLNPVGFDHQIRNNILVACPLVFDLRGSADAESTAALTIENNTIVADPASLEAARPAIRILTDSADEFLPNPIVFRSNLISGWWTLGVYLGTRLLDVDSVFGNNGFVDWGEKRLGQWSPQYGFAGQYTNPAGIEFSGLNALDAAWTDAIGVSWSSTRTYDALHSFSQFVEGGFSLQPRSPLIDQGHPDLPDADGSPGDRGAYGGPGGGAWDDPTTNPTCPEVIAESVCLAALTAAGADPQ